MRHKLYSCVTDDRKSRPQSFAGAKEEKNLKKAEKKSRRCRRAGTRVCQVQMHIQSVKGHGGAEGEGVGGKKKELHQYHEEFKAVSGKQEDGKAN